MVKNGVKGGKFYMLLPDKENTGREGVEGPFCSNKVIGLKQFSAGV